MGNLGKYQDITALAKSLGGVDNLIKKIEAGAVAKAAPKLLAAGVVVGGVLLAGGMAAVDGGKDLLSRYRARQLAANDAKDQLRSEAENAAIPDEPITDAGADSSSPGEVTQP